MNSLSVLVGDCIGQMRTLPEQSVHCCVTSPPYFGLRDYGVSGQIGQETTPEQFVQKLVEVFREVKRVLRDDGTLWLNIGDSYAGYWGDAKAKKESRQSSADTNGWTNGFSMNARPSFHDAFDGSGIKNKDLIGIPWMLAFALRADGWFLRQDIIWHKPNPMPESVRDRCTKAHEYIFLLSKSPRYYFDHEAAKEPAVGGAAGNKARTDATVRSPHFSKGTVASGVPWTGGDKRNRRDVWTVATRPFKGAHFATFPPALIEPCILAGCPEGGTVLDPFGGSGTSAGVAIAHGRNAVLCELNPQYVDLIPARIKSITDKPFLSQPHYVPFPAVEGA